MVISSAIRNTVSGAYQILGNSLPSSFAHTLDNLMQTWQRYSAKNGNLMTWAGTGNWRNALLGLMLSVFLFYYLIFTETFFEFSKQLYLGWGCFFAIFILYRLKRTGRQPLRAVFLVLSAFLAVRYFEWRITETLLYTGPFDFIGMSLVFLAEVYGLIIYFLGMFVNIWPLESKPAPWPDDTEKLPTVDVFIPTYNEPDDIIRITATAAAQIDYPKEKLRIHILDDGATQAKRSHTENGMAAWERHYRLRLMAKELGIGYFTRETNQQAKAGNINHALQYTDGEVILILDCDHVPTQDILRNTIGHFIADPKLFLVQTPHFFINPTPVEKNLEGINLLSVENDMFYRRIHPALNFWNASYFCGSAALLRRKFLMEVGGICGTTITEDAETAFQLHSRGYNSRYVNRPMVCGLSPESYDQFVIQRSRWAQGMVQLVMLNNPLKTKGLTLPQKMAYFNSSFFWLFGFPRFVYFIAPAMYLVFGLNVYHASWLQILAYTLPYVLSIYVVMDYLYAGTRQPFFSEIYESVQSLFLIPALFSVLLNPWKPSFKVTPKGLTNEKNYLSPLAAPFFLVIAINVAAVTLAATKWFTEPALRDVIMVTGTWSIYNLYLAVVSLGAFWERRQIRRFYRIAASGAANVFFPRMGVSYCGKVRNVSLTGIGFEIALPFLPCEQEQVVLQVKDGYGREYRFENTLRRTVSRNGKYFCGSEFVTGRVSYTDVVSYVFGDSARWQENWAMKSASRGTSRMLWHFMKTGVSGFGASAFPFLQRALLRFWTQAFKWATTPVLRDKMLAAASWSAYHLYLTLASLVEWLERRPVRKLQRFQRHGAATIYFPRLNATLRGEVVDVSLAGIGIAADWPFELKEREQITITLSGENDEQFSCLIRHIGRRGGQSLCGAEFIVDVFSHPRIVRLVHGDAMQMLRYVSAPGGYLTIQWKAAVAKVSSQAANNLLAVLAYIFLNPEANAGRRLGISGKQTTAAGLVRAVIIALLAAPFFTIPETARAEIVKLPLEKFTPEPALEMRCINGSQNLSIPIPERWDVRRIILSLHYTMSSNMVGNISQMVVRFNGEPVAQMKLDPLVPSADADVALPISLVRPGNNIVTFQVAQHYQTSACEQPCSPDLWTNISVHESSLQIEYDLKPLPLHMGETINMIFDPRQFPEMTVNLVTDVSTPEAITLAGIVASGVARHFDNRKVKFSHSTDIMPGIDNILIGTTRFAGNVLAPYGIKLASADGGLIKLLHLPKEGGGDNYHVLIVVAGGDTAPLRIAAETFANMSLPYPGTAEMRAYEFNMPDISMYGGRHVLTADKLYTFETLGLPTSSFYGYSGNRGKMDSDAASELSFRLPPDFLIKQNQYARLMLNFSYGAGMRSDSALGISVNGTQVRDIHLDNAAGNYIEGEKIDIPTYLFRPGENTISFKSNLIQRQLCDAINNGLYATIYGNSTLHLPPMPHFVEMPKLELFALNGFPFTRWPDGYETLLYLPQHDSASIDTALDLIGMITQRNGFPLFGAKVAYAEPKDWNGELLVVGRMQDIPKSIMESAPMKTADIATIPYPVNRGWDSETTISLSKQKSGLGEGIGLLMEFESPIKRGRSIVVATAQNGKDLLALGDALLEPKVQNRLKGDLALIRLDTPEYDLNALSVGNKYSTGDKGNISLLNSFLYANPYLLNGLMVLSIVVLGRISYRALRLIRRKRAQDEEDLK